MPIMKNVESLHCGESYYQSNMKGSTHFFTLLLSLVHVAFLTARATVLVGETDFFYNLFGCKVINSKNGFL